MDKLRKIAPEAELRFFDVGLGDCTIAVSRGKVLLIDGGSWYCDSLRLFLRDRNIQKIDYLICTHAHEDHVDGLAELAESVVFDCLYCNIDEFPKSRGFTKLKRYYEQDGKHIVIPEVGDSIEFGCCKATFLSPGNNLDYKTGNDRSLTCMIECGARKILMCADAGAPVMEDWIQAGMDIKADILKVPHHGLAGLRPAFLDAVQPAAAVISYGRNEYGLLSDDLMDNLNKRKINVLRTDREGDIDCKIQNNEWNLTAVNYRNLVYGKKLLILGANEETGKFVRHARKLGIYTIVTDNIVTSPAKAIADKKYDIDGKSIEELLRTAAGENIDGVMVGAADPLVMSYMEIAKRLGLPCYISENNIDFFINKKVFKQMCSAHGLNTVKEYDTGGNWKDVKSDHVEYPCIVKPIRGRGGKGVSLCKTPSELKRAFEIARKFSDDGEVIIEAYMECTDIIANYFFSNGTAYLIGVSDRKVLSGKSKISPVTYGNVYPSYLTDTFIEKCHDKFISLFHKLKIWNGILEMQIFWDGENFYPYDPACILGGELSSPIFSEVLGIDLIDCFLTYSLTGNMNCFQVPSDGAIIPGGGCAESIWILLKPGTIGKVEGIRNIRNVTGVMECLQRLHENDTVTEEMFETEKAVFARIWVRADDHRKLSRLAGEIRKRICVFDTNGDSMIWEGSETKS